jgi:transposase
MSIATFNIVESIETLLELLSHEKDGCKHKRIEALYLLKSQKAKTFRDVGKMLDVPAQRVGIWLKEYHQNGLEGLLLIQKQYRLKDTNIIESIDTLSQLISQEDNPQRCKRLQALYLLKTSSLTSQDIADSLEVSLATIQNWLKKYRQEGLEGLLESQVKQRFEDVNIVESIDFLLNLISQEKDEKTLKRLEMLYLIKTQKARTSEEIAKILNVDSNTLRWWLKEYRKGRMKALLPDGKYQKIVNVDIIESPETLLDLLEQEKDIWNHKKLQALYLLTTQKAKTSEDIAKIIEVHPLVPSAWIRKYRSNGLTGLLGNRRTRLSAIPNWAVERLLEELQEVEFLPNATTVKIWMATVLGIEVTLDIASEILASKIKPRWDLNSKQELAESPTQLSIEPEIYLDYAQWKEEKGFSSDYQALERLMYEFFDTSISATPDTNLDETISLEPTPPATLPEIPSHLNQSQLSKRLEVSNAVLSKNRNRSNFLSWTRLRDPNKVAWQWVPNIRQYKSLI